MSTCSGTARVNACGDQPGQLGRSGGDGVAVRRDAEGHGRSVCLKEVACQYFREGVWLYEMWMRQVVLGGETSDAGNADQRRHHAARRVFIVEVVLVCGFLVLAHALLDLDWQSHALWGAIGALAGAGLGVVGCALALSSTLAQREYRRP